MAVFLLTCKKLIRNKSDVLKWKFFKQALPSIEVAREMNSYRAIDWALQCVRALLIVLKIKTSNRIANGRSYEMKKYHRPLLDRTFRPDELVLLTWRESELACSQQQIYRCSIGRRVVARDRLLLCRSVTRTYIAVRIHKHVNETTLAAVRSNSRYWKILSLSARWRHDTWK